MILPHRHSGARIVEEMVIVAAYSKSRGLLGVYREEIMSASEKESEGWCAAEKFTFTH
jgi:hypothetical protein